MAEKKSTFKGDLKSERAVNEFLQKLNCRMKLNT